MTFGGANRRLGVIGALTALATILLCLRLIVAARTGLTDDEAYYRVWSLALAPSYLDHPPLVAVLIRIGRSFAGDTELGIRVLAPLLLAVGGLVLYRIANLYAGAAVAAKSVVFYLAMPLLAVGGVIITPDLPSVLFYGLVIWTLFELSRSQNPNWWLATGAFAGLGLLSKYTNFFAGATILIWLLAVPQNRNWLQRWQLWGGGSLALSFFLPVLVWNAEHEWASFAKQFGRVTREESFELKYIFEMAGGYLALASPVIAALSVVGLFRVVRRAFALRGSDDVLVAASIAPLLLYFLFHSLHGRVQSNWLAPVYPVLALSAAVATEECVPSAWRTRLTVVAGALGFVMIATIYAHAFSPLLKIRKDPTEQMRGWPELAGTMEKLLLANQGTWIATSSYATNGQLSFAYKGRIPVVQLNEPLRYVHLPPADDQILTHPGLYVELERRANSMLLETCFEHVQRLVTAARGTAAAAQTVYAVYRVAGFKEACRPSPGFRIENRSAERLSP